ncbi:manganese ion homeostasis [Blastomyces dermatitidis ER-3]|uniref:Manganese ion homeostasis n=2 Tax=Ajellomyces dermatitidis TaxID=5039 RepID=F2T305_AJEDA|nr:manganese ion homeostasis [Blastomyces dermatitidis ER-3]EEQ88567.2 manganese ion homeostasis [Blastomyces dermatitidis ER-3]EGE77265.1 manganese ion homeostasis [Blastomyces dermatitidis ATCC 18188]
MASRSHRDHFVEPPSLVWRIYNSLPPVVTTTIASIQTQATRLGASCTRETRRRTRCGYVLRLLRLACSLQNVLILLWGVTLWWGERTVFRDSVRGCEWTGWEQWPEQAVPHHVVFIADPQLVDPHTYPGRPWPLSSLTVFYADLYLYRTYSLLQRDLRPDTTFFLGDLFDGGREWGTERSSSPEERFKKYGHSVWMEEYRRFVRLFFDTWKLGGVDSAASERGRKIIASLPGNHDLGFGHGIQKPVLERFQTYFGVGNRVDVLGNHSFVSVDTVSLSAMDQPDPETGGSGGDEIWRAADDFLNDLSNVKARAVKQELLALQGYAENYFTPSRVVDAANPSPPVISSAPPEDIDLPTIILTHVPFYREPGTPCGPLRERFPPSSTDPLPEKDERNAIRVSRGYQYQNVLSDAIGRKIIRSAGANVKQIYSGDDHDYCEIIHREFSSSPKEITVKTLSLAMGVRRPGFQMASLYNSIDLQTGNAINTESSSSSSTIQNHLCLLPDQISIFIQYGYVLFLTILVLLVRAVARTFRTAQDPTSPASSHDSTTLLPLTHSRQPSKHLDKSALSTTSSTSTSSPTYHSENRFSNRTTGTGHDEVSESLRRSDLALDEKLRDGSWAPKRGAASSSSYDRVGGGRSSFRHVLRTEFVKPLMRIAIVAGIFYLWLVWTWL